MQILMDLWIPATARLKIDLDELHIVARETGETYAIYEMDDDEYREWLDDEMDFDKLMVTIFVESDEYEFTGNFRGEVIGDILYRHFTNIEITSCPVPGLDFLDPSPRICGDSKAEEKIAKMVESR